MQQEVKRWARGGASEHRAELKREERGARSIVSRAFRHAAQLNRRGERRLHCEARCCCGAPAMRRPTMAIRQRESREERESRS